MGYSYEAEKPNVMTDEGQKDVMKLMQIAQDLLKEGRTVRMEELTKGFSGSNWTHMAYVDRLCEMGLLLEISGRDIPAQHRVFIST